MWKKVLRREKPRSSTVRNWEEEKSITTHRVSEGRYRRHDLGVEEKTSSTFVIAGFTGVGHRHTHLWAVAIAYQYLIRLFVRHLLHTIATFLIRNLKMTYCNYLLNSCALHGTEHVGSCSGRQNVLPHTILLISRSNNALSYGNAYYEGYRII